MPAFGKLKSLRILRVLRPLRLLQRSPGMKLMIQTLIKTLPSVMEVTAVVLVFHVVFAYARKGSTLKPRTSAALTGPACSGYSAAL